MEEVESWTKSQVSLCRAERNRIKWKLVDSIQHQMGIYSVETAAGARRDRRESWFRVEEAVSHLQICSGLGEGISNGGSPSSGPE